MNNTPNAIQTLEREIAELSAKAAAEIKSPADVNELALLRGKLEAAENKVDVAKVHVAQIEGMIEETERIKKRMPSAIAARRMSLRRLQLVSGDHVSYGAIQGLVKHDYGTAALQAWLETYKPRHDALMKRLDDVKELHANAKVDASPLRDKCQKLEEKIRAEETSRTAAIKASMPKTFNLDAYSN